MREKNYIWQPRNLGYVHMTWIMSMCHAECSVNDMHILGVLWPLTGTQWWQPCQGVFPYYHTTEGKMPIFPPRHWRFWGLPFHTTILHRTVSYLYRILLGSGKYDNLLKVFIAIAGLYVQPSTTHTYLYSSTIGFEGFCSCNVLINRTS